MAESAPHGHTVHDQTGPDRPVGYPSRWEADVVTRDGGTVHVRPIRPDDAELIRDLHGRLSAETIYLRFFSPMTNLSTTLLERFVRVDYVDRLALVAVLGDDIIAVGRYERLPSTADEGDEAEVAFLVDDNHQGRGLGTMLLEHLVAAAKEAGIARFVADTLPENNRMLRMFHEAGFDDHRTFADGVVRVVFSITATEESRSLSHRREREAAARSVRKLLSPRAVAIIGASRRRQSLGHEVLSNVISGGFNGPVFPVNPEAVHVGSVRSFPIVADIPDPVDLAVVVVPAASVASVVEECARKHVGGLVVVTSGFAEAGPAGLEAQRRLVAVARRNGMRLIGPNSMGIVNTDPTISLNATLSPMPPAGRIGFIAQSGGLGVVILDELGRRGLGVSTFVSAGNKADVSGNDLLQYWDDDPATDIVAMYIETFGNPRTFGRVARRISRRKPIVVVKSARSVAGSLAADPHGVDLQHDEAVDALFRRSGVIRTDTLEELFDVAQLLAAQPLPAGRRVAIIGNTGGPGVLAADACVASGLEVVELSAATQELLASSLPWHGNVRNPVDLASDARPATFGLAIEAVLADPSVDAAIALFTSPSAAPSEAVAGAIGAAASGAPDKPVLACVLGRRGLIPTGGSDNGDSAIPSFAFPEAAARALGRVADYSDWRRRPAGHVPDLAGIDVVAARVAIEAWRDVPPDGAGPGEWVGESLARTLAEAYGIAVTSAGPPGSPPSPGSSPSPGSLPSPGSRVPWDIAAGVVQDPLFGPLVTLGPAPRPGELPRRRATRSVPLTDADATELRSDVLGGRNGEPQGAEAALDDLLARVGRLAGDVPEVMEMEVRPISRDADGRLCSVVRMRLRPWEPRPELALRRLR